MVDKIQKTGHKQSQYDQQTSDWLCDGARLGSPCESGPKPNGSCPHAKIGTRHPCQPKQVNGVFQCCRSEQIGGTCKNGPDEFGQCGLTYPACRPKMDHRKKRKQVSRIMIALSVAFLAFVLGADNMKTWMQTENISLQHRFSDDCKTCHDNSGEQFSDWWVIGNKNFWAPEPSTHYPCTQCHLFKGPEMNAHNLENQQISSIQKHLNPSSPLNQSHLIACHQCHKEHKGATGIEAKLDNQQCQNCHQKQYTGFDNSHPEFKQFPLVKQQRPLFDHATHFKRFNKSKYKQTRPKNCASCHMQNSIGDIQMPTFDSACADCHLKKDLLDIGGKNTSAVSWLSVPRMDADALAIGLWPNCKSSGLKTVDALSPITLSFLNADPVIKEAIQLLRENNTRFDKIKKANPKEIKAMTTLAWGFKKLLWDLGTGKKIHWSKQPSHLSKLEKNLHQQTTAINSDLLKLFSNEFFPDIKQTVGEDLTDAQGQCMDKAHLSRLKKQWGKKKLTGIQGWYIQYNLKTLELGYRTQQHKDPVQQTLMNQYWNDKQTFGWLIEKKKSINCQKCHRQNSQANAWQWQQQNSSFDTQYSHKPHLILGLECSSCHLISEQELDPKNNNEWTLSNHSDFLEIKKERCQQCHKTDGRTNQCSSCHKYHSAQELKLNQQQTNWQHNPEIKTLTTQ